MELIERQFRDLSALKYRIFTCYLGGEHGAKAIVLAFSGIYGDGSQGNGDGQFMRMVTYAATSIWRPHAVVFDLRELDYVWGDTIWEMYGCGLQRSGVEDLPYATVVSDRCRKGFSTCVTIVAPMFDDLESALQHVAPIARESLDRLFDELDSNTQ